MLKISIWYCVQFTAYYHNKQVLSPSLKEYDSELNGGIADKKDY